MLLSLFALVFPVMLLIAAWCDLRSMLIPNWISIVLALAFFPAAALAGLSLNQIGVHLAVGACVLLVCATLFYIGVFGGGDAKLISAASLWTGLAAGANFAMATALAGGGLALVLIVLRRLNVQSEAGWAKRLLNPAEGAPYAVAIAIGGLLAAPHAPILSSSLPGLSV
ncbi:MAG: prepilin peptidase [Hyphomonadaceae bacterium]